MSYETFIRDAESELLRFGAMAEKSTIIDSALYEQYDVKRGLRDINGNGVVCGLTDISDIVAFGTEKDGSKVPCDGELYYRGINIKDLIHGFTSEERFGFEETAYLLLFGELPNAEEQKKFNHLLSGFRRLPTSFVRDIIMKAPSVDMMNVLSRSVLTLYAYDEKADDVSVPNVLRQTIQLAAQFPLLSVYGYQTCQHYNYRKSLIIHNPVRKYSTAENILHLLRVNGEFTALEARILDMCLVLHAEHGGGNNSTFTTHVVTSSGTDTYSAFAASLGSLKGPRHGGANIKVMQMFADMKEKLGANPSDSAIKAHLSGLLNKEAFDKTGLIYGMGHAVYSLSDPRCVLLKEYVGKLAEEKGLLADFELYQKVEQFAPELIAEKRKIYKGVSPNIDFYSGLVYSMLNLPPELYTPIFAISRIIGWGAHRIEELSNKGKIIRPGYLGVCGKKTYVPIDMR